MTLESPAPGAHIKGGYYNRVMGVKVHKTKVEKPASRKMYHKLAKLVGLAKKKQPHSDAQEYILRIPRDGAVYMEYDIATLEFAALRVPHTVLYPVPEVVMYDITADNALGHGYMLQDRMPGRSLEEVWSTLNNAQKKSAARGVCQAVVNMHSITNPCAGIISRRNALVNLVSGGQVEPMPIPSRLIRHHALVPWSNTDYTTSEPTDEFLLSLCKRQRKYKQAHSDFVFTTIWARFEKMINKLQELEFFDDNDRFHFYHGDFYPRNLLVEVIDESSVQLTGILDWDSAAFVPKFMSTRAPFFLWADDDAFEEEESDVLITTPDNPEKLEYKRIFEEIAGEDFVRASYTPEYILARRMYYILTRGVNRGQESR
ncbi:phosphotransferase enzyme family-domain-containing protein [Massariosphaeria phaeospora]|uniref:Phosphotransferase enzyme family-domain-containing protein n=1 Tax=Massariosphaeria phaeospora TaxID=100035 RepID=A0A7C8MC03_9PLEO|nr:phosphotransferase enzyme family-domain-containing protein [Massariosphaeria phaeospora]